MAAKLPGAAFLQRRLARAQAVPPAERLPDVQAFITCVQLGEEACQLLPLTRGGQEALPLRNPATVRRQGLWLTCIRLSCVSRLGIPLPVISPAYCP